jgi:hypothetical protein
MCDIPVVCVNYLGMDLHHFSCVLDLPIPIPKNVAVSRPDRTYWHFKMKAAGSFETSESHNPVTQHHTKQNIIFSLYSLVPKL